MLRLVAVTLQRGDGIALDAVTMDVPAGELVLVEGGRGAGKTSLIEVAGTRRRPQSGQVWIAGHDVARIQVQSLPFVRRNIGYVSAEPQLLAGVSALDNVMLALGARSESREFAREAALRALGKVGVVGLASSDPQSMSGAGRRLVAIARALASSPPLVLLDDPSASLAPADIGAVLSALLGATESGASVVCASADAAFVAAATRAGARRLRLDGARLSSTTGPLGVVSSGNRALPFPPREALP